MALDRPTEAAVAVPDPSALRDGGSKAAAPGERGSAGERTKRVLCYALPADAPKPAPHTVPLYAWHNRASGEVFYAVEGQAGPKGYIRIDKPLGRVWRYPLSSEILWQ